MWQGNGLIIGKDGEGTRIYPSDWPCRCGHGRNQHGRVDKFVKLGCKMRGNKVRHNGKMYEDDCGGYWPVDNLSYVELKAHERKLSI